MRRFGRLKRTFPKSVFCKLQTRVILIGPESDARKFNPKAPINYISQRFRSLMDPGPLNTVGHQRLEYMAPKSFFRRDNSFMLDSFDPLVKGESQSDVLLDRYITYRATTGKPMTQAELRDAAIYANSMGGYGPNVAKSIMARAR